MAVRFLSGYINTYIDIFFLVSCRFSARLCKAQVSFLCPTKIDDQTVLNQIERKLLKTFYRKMFKKFTYTFQAGRIVFVQLILRLKPAIFVQSIR